MSGADRIGANRHQLSLGLPVTDTARRNYVVENIALLIVDWSIEGTSPGGHDFDLEGCGVERPACRRLADGRPAIRIHGM